MNRRPQLRIVAPEEAAAVVAALDRFMRDTAPTPAASAPRAASPWARAGLLEATGHVPDEPVAWQRRARH